MSTYDEYLKLEQEEAELRHKREALLQQLDKEMLTTLHQHNIHSAEDLNMILDLQPDQKANDQRQDVYLVKKGNQIKLSRSIDGNVGYVLYQLKNDNLLLIKADDQKGIIADFTMDQYQNESNDTEKDQIDTEKVVPAEKVQSETKVTKESKKNQASDIKSMIHKNIGNNDSKMVDDINAIFNKVNNPKNQKQQTRPKVNMADQLNHDY